MHTHTVAYPEEQIKCYISHSWLDFLRQTVVGVLQARVVGDHFVRLVSFNFFFNHTHSGPKANLMN